MKNKDDKITIEVKKQDILNELICLYSWNEKKDAVKLKKEAEEQ